MGRKTRRDIAKEQINSSMAGLAEELVLELEQSSDKTIESKHETAERATSFEDRPIAPISSKGKFLSEDNDYFYFEVLIEDTYKHSYNHFRTRTGEEKEKLLQSIKSLGYLLEKPTAEIDSHGKFGITKGWNRRNCWAELGNNSIHLRVRKKVLPKYEIYTDLFTDNKVNKTISPSEDYELFLKALEVIQSEVKKDNKGNFVGGLYNHMQKFGYEETKSKRYLGIKNKLIDEWQNHFIGDNISQNTAVELSKLTISTQNSIHRLYNDESIKLTTSNLKLLKVAEKKRGDLSIVDIKEIFNQENWIEKKSNVKIPNLPDKYVNILKTDFAEMSFSDAFIELLEVYSKTKEAD